MMLPALGLVAGLLTVAVLAVPVARAPHARQLVYGACLLLCAGLLAIALSALLDAAGAPSSVALPLGIPWLGAHFRLDPLAASPPSILDEDLGPAEPRRPVGGW